MTRKVFNVSGDCKPGWHYMVDIKGRLEEIKEMVDRGDYFTVNRARQFGKTTTLKALGRFLQKEYVVLSLDFQKLSHEDFETESGFVQALSGEILKKPVFKTEAPNDIIDEMKYFLGGEDKKVRLANLFECFSSWCDKC